MIKNKRIGMIIFAIIFCFLPLSTSYAHSGRTDSSGGHHDYQNKSGLGSYHYHHGYGPHLHPGGVCPYEGEQDVYVPPSPSISINNQPSELYIGDTSEFTCTVQNATNYNINVQSSNENIVKVNPDNTLTAVNEGDATITVSAAGLSQKFVVVVKPVQVSSIEINNAPTEIQLDNSQKLEANILPTNASNKNIVWTSENENIVKVTEDGMISGCSVGTTTITATANNGVKTVLPLKVYEVFPDKIETNIENIELECKETQLIKVKILPENANNKNYELQIKNTNLATVIDGQSIKAKRDGVTELEIITDNGISKKIPLKIYHIPVDSITIRDYTEYLSIPFSKNTIHQHSNLNINAVISPKNATYDEAIWESNNENVIDIRNNKMVINGFGYVTLTANTYDGITASIDLHVIDLNTIIFLAVECLFFGCIYTIIIIKNRKISYVSNKK